MISRISLEEVVGRHQTVATSSRQISGRPSLLLRWQSEQAGRHAEEPQFFWGEACPLEGFGGDTFEAARRDLQSVEPSELDETLTLVCGAFQNLSSTSEAISTEPGALLDGPSHPISLLESCSERFKSPSARHCFETVVMGAAALTCGVPALRLLTTAPVAFSLRTSAVLDPFSPDLVSQVRKFCERGVSTIKLKCGRDVVRECEVIANLAASRDEVPSLRLRFDVNQGFSPGECLQLSAAASGLLVDWIEDPTASFDEWEQLGSESELNLAVDEPLLELRPEQLHEVPSQVVILKPMALGGWSRCLRFAAAARAQNKCASLSHFFDGPIALDAAISLAFALQSPGFVPGLGDHVALAQHLPRRARGLQGEELRIVEARA